MVGSIAVSEGKTYVILACVANGFKGWGLGAQNTTQKAISIVFCVSAIRHDSSLSKFPKQK
jgi:hypothetical protein